MAETLAGKTFRAVVNSSNGTINTDTTMSFVSEDERGILGVYGGGTIRTGQVVARMHLDWQWLTGDQSKGTSGWVLEPS